MPFHEKIFRNISFDLVANWLLMSMKWELKQKSLPIIPISDTVLSADDLSKDPSDVIVEAFVAQATEQGIISADPPAKIKISWKTFDMKVIDIRLLLWSLTDLKGIPYPDDSNTYTR